MMLRPRAFLPQSPPGPRRPSARAPLRRDPPLRLGTQDDAGRRGRPGTACGSAESAVHLSHLLGESIGAFVLVFCSLNWWHYRSLRMGDEDQPDK